MSIPVRSALLAAALVLSTSASQCVSITDPLVITLNVQDIRHSYDIAPGTVNFNNPPACITRNAGDYLDSSYDISGARLVDILVQTSGDFPGGTVNGGAVTINGVTLATYGGSWDAFHAPQSILTSPLVQRNSAGVGVLLNAIQNKGNVVLCEGGAFSSPAPAGLQMLVTVYAQASATP